MMTEHRVRHVPVVADDSLRGIVSIGDVPKSRITVRDVVLSPSRNVVDAAYQCIWPKIQRSQVSNACEGPMINTRRTVAPLGLPSGYSGAAWRIHGRGG
jgi:hypothetical protein